MDFYKLQRLLRQFARFPRYSKICNRPVMFVIRTWPTAVGIMVETFTNAGEQ